MKAQDDIFLQVRLNDGWILGLKLVIKDARSINRQVHPDHFALLKVT